MSLTEERRSETIPASQLRIAGITSFTTIDFPGKLSAVAFLQGCPWRCVYCQNAWMQPRSFDPAVEHSSWEAFEHLLKRRQGLLDGVVFSGGEPCVDPALPAAVKAAKAMGYAVGLHTSGAYPRRFAEVVGDLDWVGLDVKAPPENDKLYSEIAGVPMAAKSFIRVFDALQASGTAFECRTTAHPDYLTEDDLMAIARWLQARGVQTWALQIYRRPPNEANPRYEGVGSDYPSPAVLAQFRRMFPNFIERRD